MTIQQLPFYWRLKEPNKSYTPVPEFLPFTYDFLESVQLLIQKRERDTLEYLRIVYKEDENIGYMQNDNKLCKGYGDDFLVFIKKSLKIWGAHIQTAVELGCGGCVTLEELKNLGYKVIGIDPGPLAVREGKTKTIKVINDFFPTTKFEEKVDFMFHMHVLEHIDDPIAFLAAQLKQLNNNGLVITSVPDSTEGVCSGDISMTMHQHVNYFDRDSLKNVFEAAGFEVVSIERSSYGGQLFCCGKKPNSTSSHYIPKQGISKFQRFNINAINCSNNFEKQVKLFQGKKMTVGFYGPLRTLPYLSTSDLWSGFRFFEDTIHWHKKCFDGVPNIQIENFEDLKSNPVDVIFIMSTTFGEKISNKITQENIPCKKIVTLKEIITNEIK